MDEVAGNNCRRSTTRWVCFAAVVATFLAGSSTSRAALFSVGTNAASENEVWPGVGATTGNRFIVGTGFEQTESSNDLLAIAFDVLNSLPGTSNTLSAGQVWTFQFGTIARNEPNISSGGGSNETDNLDLAAVLRLTNPLTSEVKDIAVVSTASGSPGAGTYTLDFDPPAAVAFGTGGSFLVNFGGSANPASAALQTALSFSAVSPDPVPFYVTIQLVSDSQIVGGIVPEPMTMLSWGFVIALCGGVNAARRLKR